MKKILTLLLFVLSAMIAKAQTDIHIDTPAIKRTVDTSQIYIAVQKPASFPGGIDELYKYFQKNSKYPVNRGNDALQVFVTLVVERDGSLTSVKIIRGVSLGFDTEAIRLVKASAPWIPGEQNGYKIRQQYTLPVSFER